MSIRTLTAMAAAPIAAAASIVALSVAPASATGGDPCYENKGEVCPEPAPTAPTYNLIVGTRGVDTLFGTNGNDAIFGLRNDDRLIGRWGNDLLWGGRGNDTLVAGGGSDRLRGGPGQDVCIGDVDDSFFSCETVVITG